jgi:hypothetical protein
MQNLVFDTKKDREQLENFGPDPGPDKSKIIVPVPVPVKTKILVPGSRLLYRSLIIRKLFNAYHFMNLLNVLDFPTKTFFPENFWTKCF